MKQDKYCFIILFEVPIVFQEVQKNSHIFAGNSFPFYAVINQHFSHFKVKRISPQDFVIHSHLKRRTYYAADAMDGTVSSPF